MTSEIVIAMIAAIPPTLAVILGFLANRRSLRRSIGGSTGVPLVSVIRGMDSKVERIESKVDRLGEGQADVRERLAHLEGERQRRLWSPPR